MISISKSKMNRVYADTSVFGGMFDEEFETASKVFFDAVNTLNGFGKIAIYSPLEVIENED